MISDRGSVSLVIEEATCSVIVAGGGARWLVSSIESPFESGVTITHLAERERSLEEAYFALTGTHSGDVEDRTALGMIR